MSEYQSSLLEDIARTHGVNMRKANQCIERHGALLEAVDEILKCYREQD